MDNNFNKIYNFFEKITEQKLDMTKYSHRLMLQKIVYLLQSVGINFEYKFNWYIKGPYCTKLAKDSFEFIEQNKQIEKTSFIENENKIINKFKQNFKSEFENVKESELLGSLIFIEKEMQINNKNEAMEKLLSLKPWLKKEEIEKMQNKIKKSKMFE